MASLNDLLICAQCKRTVHRKDTFEIVDKKDGYKKKRLCRDCQVGFYIDELKRTGIGGAVGKTIRVWSKELKEGKNGR